MDDTDDGAMNQDIASEDGGQDIERNMEIATNDETATAQGKVKDLLKAFDEQDELNLNDEERQCIWSLLQDHGDTLYGIGAYTIYVWLKPRLVPVGCWIQQDILSKVPLNEKDLVANPKDAYPNVDLVGALWSTKTNSTHAKETDPKHRRGAKEDSKAKKSKNSLHWRELSQVIDDPDQSNGQRTVALKNAGLEKATGIKFNVFGIRGMVVYYVEAGVDQKVLMEPANEAYLCRVAYLKGTLLSVIEARRKVMEIMPDTTDINQSDTDATALVSPSVVAQQLCFEFRRDNLRKDAVAWLKKTFGAGAQIPPCFSWKESFWTAAGTFVGLVLIAVLNKTFKVVSEEEHFLILGPFGALMMLQFGLVGSPAGQPRSVLGGHAIAGSIALGLTYIPEAHLAIWLRQILSVTLANFVMVKVGVPCPPASAHSLIYAEGEHDWVFWGLALVGCVVSFLPAIFFNNLNPGRQYPSFWGYAPARVYKDLMEETKKDTKKVKQVTKATGKGTVDTVKQVTKDTGQVTMKTGKNTVHAGIGTAEKVQQVTEETGNDTAETLKQVVQIPTGSSHSSS